ncbi:imidazole glycerol phosphate synthase, glutamine amidotransferase subunit [Leptospira fainei serovar Hurstbridge str. BUT 6]|uniref:Imidazole glycerol phosphate synthase subunit HisH n=1 Tax=Leptospira fainei serovar Hurstbridge str. BUT 6 TaxID=1193011 RepID=S3V3M5_9LEPT|nr:imidazole glycerol phosphate synthase subunit HisH [Leptospira fainei]EPG75998.1 imidazole glycerol phosphate synthase, glutamine amidotransferase subunit [Leptospira fainei serovar Hurstbridge str. BUT 6]
MNVIIIDYGMGNLSSVLRAFQECGASAEISDNPLDLKRATHIVLPGVGAFPDGINNLRERKFDQAIEHVVADGIPLLGICLGMQLLADTGYEVRKSDGLGLISGEVKKLDEGAGVRIPHVGWNEVKYKKDDSLFVDIPDNSDFYFVHSYHFEPASENAIVGITPYGQGFVSVVRKDNVMGVQFHPEKSSQLGFKVIRNFLDIN